MIATVPARSVTVAVREYRQLPGASAVVGAPTLEGLIELARLDTERMPYTRPEREQVQTFINRWKLHIQRERSKAARSRKADRGGRPVGAYKAGAPRCYCGKSTLARAEARRFDCCRAAGLRP